MTLFTAALMPLLLTLGFWQLDREKEKLELQALHESRIKAAPVPVAQLDWVQEDLSFQPVVLTGRFDNDRYLLLDNRIHERQVGYEVLMPFTTTEGYHAIINRGWIAQGLTREQLPKVAPVAGELTITGSVYMPLSEPFLLSDVQEAQTAEWPKVVQKIDMAAWNEALKLTLLPYTIRIDQSSTAAFSADWPTVNMEPEKHRGYAVQWFSMAAALMLMYAYFGTRRTSPTPNHE